MKRKDIDPQKPNIHEVFTRNGGEKYVIPKYQRAYAWKKDNAEKLWEDITRNEGKDDYFIGTMVLSQAEDAFEIEVIDGQQRLTTVSLLLFALYLHYYEIDESKAIKHILSYLKVGDIDDEYEVLTLSKINLEFFRKLLEQQSLEKYKKYREKNYKTENKSNKYIFDVLDYFLNIILEKKESDRNLEIVRLNDILKLVRNNIFFLTLKVTDYAEASKLFEVLNNRGVDLTKADLIKNHLFSVAEKQSSISSVEKSWEKLQNNISIEKLEQFFRYFSLVYSKEDDLYIRMENTIKTKSAKTVSDLIYKSSEEYKKFIDPNFSDEDRENNLLEELKILGVSQFYTLILSTYNNISTEEKLDLLEFIVNFTFRYSTICGKNPNKLESLYADLAYEFNIGNKSLNDIKNEISLLNPSRVEFENAFREKEFKTTKIPRYILGKIENYISSDEKKVDFQSVHLEHIMPKQISEWKKVDNKYVKLHQKYLNKLGNMTLLSEKINTSIKNSFFDKKVEKYNDSEINIINEIRQLDSWDEDAIKNNTTRYLEKANEIWIL